jgi:hypothetical protein
MIINTSSGRSFDTESDLTSAERHILQKILAWKSFVRTVEEFHEKISRSFESGWNHSGPVAESHAMRLIIRDIEKEVMDRLKAMTGAAQGQDNGT